MDQFKQVKIADKLATIKGITGSGEDVEAERIAALLNLAVDALKQLEARAR